MDNTKNVFGVVFLIIILLVFIIGGYFFMDYMVNLSDKDNPVNIEEDNKDYRLDTSKDYIYFMNEEEVVHEVIKKDVVVNFLGFESLNSSLSRELKELDVNRVLVGDRVIPEGITCDEDLYEFNYREYTYTKFGKYISLVINDNKYNCVNGDLPINVKSIVINKENGKELNSDSLLSAFSITEDKIIASVRERLNNTQVMEEDVQIIDINGTIEGIKNGTYGKDKALSISKNGKLVINFVVKSNKINYNDSIELN